MSTQQAEHILIAGGEDRDVMRILDASPGLNEDRVHRVATSREAVDRLSDPRHPFALTLVDRGLEPETAFSLMQFVRRDAGSPYPGLALGFIGDGITQSELRLAMRAGCPIALSRPFNRQVLAAAIKGLPADRSDFIITGAYVGPERRRPGDTPAASNRRSSALAEQSIASTADRYDIAPETIGFRFKRLPARGGPSGLALRNGLSRRTVVPAFEHIGEKKREGVTLIGRQAQA
ncbi:MAG: hypothetical protein NXI03_08740, partial [Alphaproteobacteria bacterium]|nr:hypothetical protein [Alphaproteobacteria bacterium]